MSNKLYVGNLPWSVGDEELKKMFSEYGEVLNANVITDRNSGRSRGFAFVEMGTAEDAQKAIEALHESNMEDRKLIVNVARPKQDRPQRPPRY
jgi:RNA recognition motif-containing protein